MLTRRRLVASCLAATLLAARPALAQQAGDPLPSWNAGPAKTRIIAYVERVTRPGPDFAPPDERVAVFDNDGTLWIEQPLYTQFAFVIDRIRFLAKTAPHLRDEPILRTIADGDMAAIAKLSQAELMQAAFFTQQGMTSAEYGAVVAEWLARARHPKLNAPYTSLVYQPQLELLTYLRGAGFKTYIVSGGDVRFMRAFAQTVYGVPPEQVIGTGQKMRLDHVGDGVVVVAEAALDSLDDGPGKPVNIDLHIGRAPLVAVGNSDGDLPMLQFSASAARPTLQIVVHHDDATREYAYDRESNIGRLDEALDEATRRDWTIVSIRADWRVVFAAR